MDQRRTKLQRRQMKQPAVNLDSGLSSRATDGIRTRDIQLGKLVLYQLSYRRTNFYKYT